MQPTNIKIINELVHEKQLRFVVEQARNSELPILYCDDNFQPINALEPNGYSDPSFTCSDDEPF